MTRPTGDKTAPPPTAKGDHLRPRNYHDRPSLYDRDSSSASSDRTGKLEIDDPTLPCPGRTSNRSPVEVHGTSTKVTVYLRNRCEDYHKYSQEIGTCDTKKDVTSYIVW